MRDDEDHEEPKDRSQWTEFDCPSCEANNPYSDGFRAGDEVICGWCSIVWLVKQGSSGRFVLEEQ